MIPFRRINKADNICVGSRKQFLSCLQTKHNAINLNVKQKFSFSLVSYFLFALLGLSPLISAAQKYAVLFACRTFIPLSIQNSLTKGIANLKTANMKSKQNRGLSTTTAEPISHSKIVAAFMDKLLISATLKSM